MKKILISCSVVAVFMTLGILIVVKKHHDTPPILSNDGLSQPAANGGVAGVDRARPVQVQSDFQVTVDDGNVADANEPNANSDIGGSSVTGGLVIVPRDITAELAKISNLSNSLALPENIDAMQKQCIVAVLENTRLAWAECQELLNSGRVRQNSLSYGARLPFAGFRSSTDNTSFLFSFRSLDKGQLKQCTKIVGTPDPNKEDGGVTGYHLDFHENLHLKMYSSRDKEEDAWFYPSGALESVFYVSTDGTEQTTHAFSWGNDGKFIRHSFGKKGRDPFLPRKYNSQFKVFVPAEDERGK